MKADCPMQSATFQSIFESCPQIEIFINHKSCPQFKLFRKILICALTGAMLKLCPQISDYSFFQSEKVKLCLNSQFKGAFPKLTVISFQGMISKLRSR